MMPSALPFWVPMLSAVIGAIVGGIVTYLVQRVTENRRTSVQYRAGLGALRSELVITKATIEDQTIDLPLLETRQWAYFQSMGLSGRFAEENQQKLTDFYVALGKYMALANASYQNPSYMNLRQTAQSEKSMYLPRKVKEAIEAIEQELSLQGGKDRDMQINFREGFRRLALCSSAVVGLLWQLRSPGFCTGSAYILHGDLDRNGVRKIDAFQNIIRRRNKSMRLQNP